MRRKKLKNSYTFISSLEIPYNYLWIELLLNCRRFSCIEIRFIGIGLHRHDVNHDENLGIKSTMKCYRILWVIKYHPGSSTKDFSYSAIHKIAQQALPTGCFFTMGWNLFWKEHSHLYDTKIVNRPFNLHPEKWFEVYPVKSTQIFKGCHLRFF